MPAITHEWLPSPVDKAVAKLQSMMNGGPVGRGTELIDALIEGGSVYQQLPIYASQVVNTIPESTSLGSRWETLGYLREMGGENADLELRAYYTGLNRDFLENPQNHGLSEMEAGNLPTDLPTTLNVGSILGARLPVLDQLASIALAAAKSAAGIEAAKMREAASHHSGIVDKLSALIGSGGLGRRTETTTDAHSQRSGPTGPENTVAAATFRSAVQDTLNIRPGQQVAHETIFKSAPIEVTAPYMAYAAFPDAGSTAQRSVSPTHAEVEIHGQGAVMGFAAQVTVKIGASEFITRTTIHG